jgi:hypothetical protein
LPVRRIGQTAGTMSDGVMLWAGKHLTEDEELRTRRLVAMLRRIGDDETADTFERFLPEHDDGWTPDELEQGAHVGPWMEWGDVDIED